MELQERAQRIYQTQTELLKLEGDLQEAQKNVAQGMTEIDQVIIFDPELKNEQQRKVAKAAMVQANEELRNQVVNVERLKADLRVAEAKLELERNLFTAEKLAMQMAIAKLSTTVQ